MGTLLQSAVQYIEGRVEHGKKLGRMIGFPTANLSVATHYLPHNGVYGVYVYINDRQYAGVMNIGNRPTFNDGTHVTVEVHILNFQDMIYGEQMIVEPVFQIRPEEKFKCIEALIKQLKKDVQYAQYIFSSFK